MGNWQGSGLKLVVTGQKGSNRCLPHYPYLPFPDEHLHSSTDHEVDEGLVLEFQALPPSMVRSQVPDDTFWWIDAQFLPNNDAQLVVTATAFMPRLHGAWTGVKGTPKGRLLIVDLRSRPVCGRYIIGTESSAFPKVALHPVGVAVGYAGSEAVRVDSLSGESLYSRSRDIDNRSHRFVAFAPNGQVLAALSRSLGLFYLEIFHLGASLNNYQKPILCHELCPDFRAGQSHNVHVESKWSPDSSHLAISSSFGKLFVVRRNPLTTSCSVFPDLLDGELSTAGSYDFDPRVRFSVLAVGASGGLLSIMCIASCAKAERAKVVQQQLDTGRVIDCVQYNADGTALAVSFRNFAVHVYLTDDLALVRSLDLTMHSGPHVELFQNGMFPAVNRLSFSNDGRYLVTCSCDGKIRIWTVPKVLSLQDWCRRAILQLASVQNISRCDLPGKIKSFLVNQGFCDQD